MAITLLDIRKTVARLEEGLGYRDDLSIWQWEGTISIPTPPTISIRVPKDHPIETEVPCTLADLKALGLRARIPTTNNGPIIYHFDTGK